MIEKGTMTSNIDLTTNKINRAGNLRRSLWFKERKAIYREGLGTTLIDEFDVKTKAYRNLDEISFESS
jgi:hypothetical protein